MMSRSLIVMATLSASAAHAAMPLAPHQAVYNLSLASESSGIVSAEGRIAMVLKTDKCGVYDLDYRFVARFQQEEEITLTDQQTNSTENRAGTEFEFSTKTFVDGSPEKEIRGEARHDGDATRVSMQAPVARSFDLPRSAFPMQHTAELIAKAEAGERIVETKLFDGDDDSEKLLTSTSIITPHVPAAPGAEAGTPAETAPSTTVPGGASPGSAADASPKRAPQGAGETAPDKDPAAMAETRAPASDIRQRLSGLKSWKIAESYYNSDSDPDGMPIFQTSYVLYENGVSDDLRLDFGTYVFTGSLSQLDLFDATRCE
ncbi:ATP-binding protein [Aureimonas sp. SA4125]|uniref:EipB family protein n=1 Tax=Aureimonas sp. SA4125 TaxID=2826993 RepID=UPI001CC719E6|nr:DUF1849 family protein [Aureimonas sp. SA4125]BDA84715.1 ATP-binding protein [Aureimonas sp. SA4125]